MYETGIISRIRRSIGLQKLELNYRNYVEVDLHDVFQIFIFLLLAIFISMWLLVIEKINAKANKGKIIEQKNSKPSNQFVIAPRLQNYFE